MPAFVSADDLADLKATFNKNVEAWNNRDINKICESFHNLAVVYWENSIIPDDGKTTLCNNLKEWFANNNETIQVTPVTPTFRLAGNIGIVFGLNNVSIKLKEGPPESTTQRITTVFVKEGNKWLQISQNHAIVSVGD